MAKRFKTHALNLFSRIGIEIPNIEVYSKNNNLSPKMHKRLLDCHRAIKQEERDITLIDFLDEYKG
jgi:hypothetical protein